MKTMKLLCAGAFALLGAGVASADVPLIKITGSTAFRKATYVAIVDSLSSPVAAAIGGSTSDMSGAARAVIAGTLKGGSASGTRVAFQLAWAGSVGGVSTVTEGLTTLPGTTFDPAKTWLSSDAASAANTLTAVTLVGTTPASVQIRGWNEVSESGTGTKLAKFDGAAVADATNSDSLATSAALVDTGIDPTLLTEENSVAGGIGLVDFYWVKGRKSPDWPATSTAYEAWTNVTAQQGNAILAAGKLPLSFFTGNVADNTIDVLLVGRNNDSGTRLATEAESGFGIASGLEDQWQPVVTTGNITGLNEVGDAGYASGGNVAAALDTPILSGTKHVGHVFVFLGYVGRGDKNTATGAGAVQLSYNGSVYSDAALQNGQYSFWTNEHTYYLSSLASTSTTKKALDYLTTTIRGTSAAVTQNEPIQSGIRLDSNLHVSRAVEGGAITPQ